MEEKNMLVNIETERLLLRNYKREDALSMFENYCSDVEVTKYVTWYPHPHVEYTQEYLDKKVLPQNENPNCMDLAITLKSHSNNVIGNIAAWQIKENVVELGYVISRDYQGKGYMSEAVRAIVQYIFTQTPILEIIAFYELENPASGVVLQKCGFIYQKNIWDKRKFDSANDDTVLCSLYSIHKQNWLNNQ